MSRQGHGGDGNGAAGTDATVEAAHLVEVAVEWVERAWGDLLTFHHEIGHAQLLLLDAAAKLEEAGHPDLARELRDEISAMDALPDRWTYRVVDEFRSHFLSPTRDFEARVRERLTGGRRHRFEAAQRESQKRSGAPSSRGND